MQHQRSAIAGLNIVHDSDDNLSPGEDAATSPNIAEQLSAWSTFTFESDEPFGRASASSAPAGTADGEPDTDGIVDFWEALGDSKPALDAPPTPTATTTTTMTSPVITTQMTADPGFDLGAFLAGFSVDPFLIPPLSTVTPPTLTSKAKATSTTSKSTTTTAPPSKRARKSIDADATMKEAKSTTTVPITTAPPPASDVGSSEPIESGSSETPLTAAEDKRRRNTAASARFRAKKKERELAMERKSKNLEMRVTDLERECEALRRENGWLKGLVVGSTATPGAIVPPPPQTVMEPLRGKRRREEVL